MGFSWGLIFNKWTLGALAIGLLLFGVHRWDQNRLEAARESGRVEVRAEMEAARKKWREEVAEWVVNLSGRLAKAREDYERLRTERDAIADKLKKEINKYVTPNADKHCIVPAGFVYVYDAAASVGPPAVPGPTGEAVDSDSGVALSEVAASIADNYASCNNAIAEVKEWRNWYPIVKAKYEELRK